MLCVDCDCIIYVEAILFVYSLGLSMYELTTGGGKYTG